MEISNNINYSNTQVINGYYKFNNVNPNTSNQTVSTDTLFYIEVPATSQAFNPAKCRLQFSAKVTASGSAQRSNILLANVSPVSRVEVKTSSGQTIMNYSRTQWFARTIPDRLKNFDNTLSSTTNGRFIKNGSNIYDYYNGLINPLGAAVTGAGDANIISFNYVISVNAEGSFTYNTRLGDLIGGFFDLDKDIMLNESLYINLYLSNDCVCVVGNADATPIFIGLVSEAKKNYEVTQFFIKVAYQQSNAINMAIKANISTDQGIIVPFPYISNFSFNDWANPAAHTVNLSLRIYNMIGNKLRRIYLVPSSLAGTTSAVAGNVGNSNIAFKSLLNSASTIQFFIDSNLITLYDNTQYENLLNCKLSNKYWNNILQNANFFLPVYFYNQDTDNNNLNEGMPVNSDTIISFICNNTGTNEAASYDVFAEGVKNLVINRNGVAIV